MLTRKFKLFPIDDITVSEDRQRKAPTDVTSLAFSIKKVGLINPITIAKDGRLVAGYRRLTAVRLLCEQEPKRARTIPVQFYEELSPADRELVELDENIRRENLTWQDQALALARYHEICMNEQDDWNHAKTAELAGLSATTLYKALNVAPELRAGNERIKSFDSLSAADNFLTRQHQREQDDELAKLDMDEVFADKPSEKKAASTAPAAKSVDAQIRTADQDISVGDALKFMETFNGDRFNLIHCDFPYGVGMHKSEQANAESWDTYEDTPEIYFNLLETMLRSRKQIMAPSAHILFWFSMEYYSETLSLFAKIAPDLVVNKFPLIWHKSDGRGILPDPERGPRRIYETALLITAGDRKIVQATGNAYAAPTMKAEADHISMKPEPVLNHFFRMLVDKSTALLDMTCGSGTALCSAERLGAYRVLGMDTDEKSVEIARANLNRSRRLRFLERNVNVEGEEHESAVA